MDTNPNKATRVIHALFALAALIILIDFTWPGSTVNDTILDVQKRRQQYYNAARNHHYTYMVVTGQHQFLVTEGFAAAELKDKKIEYTVSPIFQEVNWYRLLEAERKSYYSLRIASGLILP
ncbi:MAG: hypothetical protein AAGD88_16160, partial [Bacteroidota bacterium]